MLKRLYLPCYRHDQHSVLGSCRSTQAIILCNQNVMSLLHIKALVLHWARCATAPTLTSFQASCTTSPPSTAPSRHAQHTPTLHPTAINPGSMMTARPPAAACAQPWPTPPPTWPAISNSSSRSCARRRKPPSNAPASPASSKMPDTNQLRSGAASSPATPQRRQQDHLCRHLAPLLL